MAPRNKCLKRGVGTVWLAVAEIHRTAPQPVPVEVTDHFRLAEHDGNLWMTDLDVNMMNGSGWGLSVTSAWN